MKLINLYSKIELLKYTPYLIFNKSNKSKIRDRILLNSFELVYPNSNEIIKKYLNEIDDGYLIPNVDPDFNIGNLPTTFLSRWIYCAIRYNKPDIVVETGISHGYSSWIILNALRMNKKGTLYSIDLPNKDTCDNYNIGSLKKETGWLVPNDLRSNWEISLGDAKEILPELLSKLTSIDIFFHDSEHSYEHMTFEYNLAFKYLKNKGLLISDDIHKNSAFKDFSNSKKPKIVLFFRKGGAILK